MSLELEITLPFGRYCATPWGRHVNEGAVEWPPSPWRVVRALTASWRVHHPSLDEERVADALGELCAAARYELPPHTTSTTRHYMPTSTSKSVLGLSAFVATAQSARVRMFWESDPSDEQLSVLKILASTVTYLGRAESRAQLSFGRAECTPDAVGPVESPEVTSTGVLDVLVPDPPLDLAAIQTTTAHLHKKRRTVPPGATWATYPIPSPMRTDARPLNRPQRTTTVLQFAVSGRGRPTMDNAALLASRFRAAVTSLAKDRPELHGHASNGGSVVRSREDDHRHAHFLVLNDLTRPQSRRVESLVLWVPEGLPGDAVREVAGLRQLYIPEHLRKRLGDSLDVVLVQADDESALDRRLVQPSYRWRTLTPFTTARHRKKHQSAEDYVRDVVRRELTYRSLPAAPDEVTVTLVPDAEVPTVRQARRTYRARSLGRERQHRGFHVGLEFAEKVAGPLTLGSLSHFGLGTFVSDGM